VNLDKLPRPDGGLERLTHRPQTCLNSPDPPPIPTSADQRMSATGYEETELTYNVNEEEQQKVDNRK
jgi:hypothetical protein